METLIELVARIKADATNLEKGLTDAERKTEASSKRMSDSLKKVGIAMAASGAAITAALGMMGKAAIDEDINMKRLATTINNSGTAYDKVKDSLEAVIAATQRKTGIADNEQRDVLNRLILVTNDYDTALGLLPTALDLAAAGGMDAATAATYLGKAYLDLEGGAKEVSVRFGQASLQFKNMEDIQNRVAGAAKNLANPLSVLKVSMDDVAETIGMNLIPMIKGAVDKIVDIAIKVQNWTKEHPELAKTLTLIALAISGVLTAVGGLILAMPVITGMVAAFGVVFHAALGPIGLISLAIAGLIAAGILLWKNWDKVKEFIADAWDSIKIIFAQAVKFIVNTVLMPFIEYYSKVFWIITEGISKLAGVFNKELAKSIEGISQKLKNARQEISDWADTLAESSKASKALREIEREAERLASTLTEEAENTANVREKAAKRATQTIIDEAKKQTAILKDEAKKQFDDQMDSLRRRKDAAQDAHNKAIDAIKSEYGYSRETAKSLIQIAYDVRDARIQAIDEEMDKAQDAHKERLSQIEEQYRLTLTDAQKALQDQLDAIDKQTDAEELASTRASEQKKLIELQAAEKAAKTIVETNIKWNKQLQRYEWLTFEGREDALKDYAAVRKAIDEYATEIQRKELLRSRQVEKDTLREKIDAIREGTSEIAIQARKDADAKITEAKRALTETITLKENEKKIAEADLIILIGFYEKERDKKIETELAQYGITKLVLDAEEKIAKSNFENHMKRLSDELETFTNNNDLMLKDAQDFVKNLNDELAKIQDVSYTVTRFEVGGSSIYTPSTSDEGGETTPTFTPWPITPSEDYATGGIVPGPVGMPQLATVHGGETIIPAGEFGGGIVVNFTQPIFFDREETMNKFVEMIRKGIRRQDRLNFGGAFAGA